MKQTSKRRWLTVLLLLGAAVLGGCAPETEAYAPEDNSSTVQTAGIVTESMKQAMWDTAQSTPLGRYPELVTYTLGKMTSENNSNMPSADTYEDNNYTRYLRDLLNVQNENAFEGVGSVQYEQLEMMAVQ